MSLKNNLNNLDLSENPTVTFTYAEGVDGLKNIRTQNGGSPIEVLREQNLLEDYGYNLAFKEYVAGAIRNNFYDTSLIEESTEHYDHKRGFTTLTATVVAPVEDIINNDSSYQSTFSGWTAEVYTGGGKFTFDV